MAIDDCADWSQWLDSRLGGVSGEWVAARATPTAGTGFGGFDNICSPLRVQIVTKYAPPFE